MSEKRKQLVEREDAVSPVIGVILMVAITVILAAVIGAFVLGLGENVNQEATAGVQVDEEVSSGTSDTVTVTWVSEGNAASIEVRESGTPQATLSGGVGDAVELTEGTEYTAGDTLHIVAITDEGTETIIRTFETTN